MKFPVSIVTTLLLAILVIAEEVEYEELQNLPEKKQLKRGIAPSYSSNEHGGDEFVPAGGYGHASPISHTVEITKPVPFPVIKYIGIQVPHPVPVAIPHPVAVPVPHAIPVHIQVPHPVPVPVIRIVAIPVERPVPVPIEKPVPYPVEKPHPVYLEKHIPVPVPKPYPVHVPVYKYIHHYPKIHYRHGWH